MLRTNILFLVVILGIVQGTLLASDLPQHIAVCCPGLFNRCHQRTLKRQLREAADKAYRKCRKDTINAIWTAVGQADLETFEDRKRRLFSLMERKPSDWFQALWTFSSPRGGYGDKYTIDTIARFNGAFGALNPHARQPADNQTLSEFVNHPLMKALRTAYTNCFLQADCTIASPTFSNNTLRPSYLEFLVRDWTHTSLLELEESMKLELALEHIGTAHRYNTFLQAFSHRLPQDLNLLIGKLCFGSALSQTAYIEKLCTQLEKRKRQTEQNEFDIFFKRCMHLDRNRRNTPWQSFWESKLLRAFIYSSLAEPNTYEQATQRLRQSIASRCKKSLRLAICATLITFALPLGFFLLVIAMEETNERRLAARIVTFIVSLMLLIPVLGTLYYPFRNNRKALTKARQQLTTLTEYDDRWFTLAQATNRARLSFEDDIDGLPDVIPMHSEV